MRRALLSIALLCLWVGLAIASEGAHHQVDPKMEIFRIINFLIFLAILWKFAGNAVKNYFSQRSEQIAKAIDEAKKAREEAEARYSEAKAKVANLEKEIEQILKNAERERDEQVARIREETQRMVERMRQQTKTAVELEVERAKLELQREAIDLAVEVAEKLLKEKITPEDQKRLLEDYINKVKEVH